MASAADAEVFWDDSVEEFGLGGELLFHMFGDHFLYRCGKLAAVDEVGVAGVEGIFDGFAVGEVDVGILEEFLLLFTICMPLVYDLKTGRAFYI